MTGSCIRSAAAFDYIGPLHRDSGPRDINQIGDFRVETGTALLYFTLAHL